MTDIKVMINNLNKWQKVCETIGLNKDMEVLGDIISILKEGSIKKESELDRLKGALNYYNSRDKENLNSFKFSIVKIDGNLLVQWNKASNSKLLKLTKLELNVIYNILYELKETKFISKNKQDIIQDINFLVENGERNKVLKEKKLI